MIEGFRFFNFQSNKDTLLHKLHAGVNVITGISDSGKTSLFRGIDWCFNNNPKGDAFRSSWGGVTKVKAYLDGQVLTRSKDKTDIYKLGDSQFKAFGKEGVPAPIKELINIDEVNIQKQLDGPFLLNKTPGAVAAHFNKVANLTKIDTSLQAIKKDRAALKSKIGYQQETLKEKEEKLSTFDYLTHVTEGVKALKEKRRLQKKHQTELEDIKLHAVRLQLIDSEIKENNEILSDGKLINSVLLKIAEASVVNNERERIKSARIKLLRINEQINENKVILEDSALIDELLTKINKRLILNTEISKISFLTSTYTKINNQLILGEESLLKLEDSYSKQLSKLKICPTCNQKIKNEKN